MTVSAVLHVCVTDGGHAATLAELERVREELVEERALRHLEAGGARRESDSDSTQEPDPVLDALQHSEDSVSITSKLSQPERCFSTCSTSIWWGECVRGDW